MAFTAKHFSLFFLLLTLLSSLQIHARDSQFFSKVSNNNNAKETQTLPNKEQQPSTLNNNNKQQEQQQQDTTFIPETENTGAYGLYGHESGQLPPTTTTSTNGGAPQFTTTTDNLPYKAETQEPSKQVYPNYYNNHAYVTPIHSNMYNGDNSMYNSQKNLGEARFMEKGYTTPIQSNSFYNGDNNMYNTHKQWMKGYNTPTSGGGNMYNTQKQGMSDTRFLENGRYYYDMNSENYNSNANQMNSRGFDSRNEYNTKGYYRNNKNDDNSYYQNNSNGGYQNQEQYQENQDDQYIP